MFHLRRRTILLVAFFLAGTIGFAVAVAPSHATFGGKNGQIAFRRYFDDAHHVSGIFTINADGTGEHQITHSPQGMVDDQPDWSPDGSLIVFTRCVVDGNCSVYTVGVDGTGLKRLSPKCAPAATSCEDDANVSFLPSGKDIVFTRATGKVRHWADWDQIQHSDLVVSDLNGRHRRVVLRSSPYEGDLNFAASSPDGKHFVYEHANSPLTKPAHHAALFVVDSNGKNKHRITPWSLDAGDNPDWSPDGRWIVFRTHISSDNNCSIDIIHANGSGLRQLAHYGSNSNVRSAAFSPDNQSIVFATDKGKGANPAVYIMRTDGSNLQQVSHSKLWDSAADWGTH